MLAKGGIMLAWYVVQPARTSSTILMLVLTDSGVQDGAGRTSGSLAMTLLTKQLGIHLAPETLSGLSKLSAQELATRDRLFWSCFIWDKWVEHEVPG